MEIKYFLLTLPQELKLNSNKMVTKKHIAFAYHYWNYQLGYNKETDRYLLPEYEQNNVKFIEQYSQLGEKLIEEQNKTADKGYDFNNEIKYWVNTYDKENLKKILLNTLFILDNKRRIRLGDWN